MNPVKTLFLIIINVFIIHNVFCQEIAPYPSRGVEVAVDTQNAIFERFETAPSINGNISTFLSEHLQYPDEAYENGISGSVVIQFVVTAEGVAKDFKIKKAIGGGCEEEAIRVLKLIKDWKPATINGRNVNAKMHIPIIFRINE